MYIKENGEEKKGNSPLNVDTMTASSTVTTKTINNNSNDDNGSSGEIEKEKKNARLAFNACSPSYAFPIALRFLSHIGIVVNSTNVRPVDVSFCAAAAAVRGKHDYNGK